MNGLIVLPFWKTNVSPECSIVRQHFWKSCTIIRGIFASHKTQESCEFGVKITSFDTSFWIIGFIELYFEGNVQRRRKEKKECYVCFTEGTAQSVVELAFKLQFGTFL